MVTERDLDAGEFSSWLAGLRHALQRTADAVVPCDGCTACCTSAQFVHIEPDEAETLAQIPPDLLFPAPRRPAGHVLLGYDERGHCPMLVGDACSIYEHRPRTCRTYDCRVFPATEVPVDDEATPAIAARASRWKFRFVTADDTARAAATRAAAAFLVTRAADLPPGSVPPYTPQLAVLAIELHDHFLCRDPSSGGLRVVEPGIETIRAAVLRRG